MTKDTALFTLRVTLSEERVIGLQAAGLDGLSKLTPDYRKPLRKSTLFLDFYLCEI